ncbi:MAG: phosphate transport system substrate-binding protein [Nitriliruptoraceae bacterium]
MKTWRSVAAVAAVAVLATACAADGTEADLADTTDATADVSSELSGEVVAAGSSTVLPVAEYVLELYRGAQPDVDASYTSIGSGGGFERLCELGDVDMSGASRAIKDEEAQACADNGIEFIELQFGVDALTMVTSNETDYLTCFTQEDIVQTFGPEGGTTWDTVLDGAPADEMQIFAPDTDSGTYGFMVEDVMDVEESRQDYTASADDNVIVQGVESAVGTWGFFGLAYYTANAANLQAIAYDKGDGSCVLPSIETAADGSYGIVRPLYLYVRTDAIASKPAVGDFVTYFLDSANAAIDFVGYVQDNTKLDAAKADLAAAKG